MVSKERCWLPVRFGTVISATQGFYHVFDTQDGLSWQFSFLWRCCEIHLAFWNFCSRRAFLCTMNIAQYGPPCLWLLPTWIICMTLTVVYYIYRLTCLFQIYREINRVMLTVVCYCECGGSITAWESMSWSMWLFWQREAGLLHRWNGCLLLTAPVQDEWPSWSIRSYFSAKWFPRERLDCR